MSKSIIFVRHGQSQANADVVIADANSPLTENGIEQARKTGYEIKGLGIKSIVCSPFIRAQQTAETIAGELGIGLDHIEIVDELKERYQGDLENKPREHESTWYFTHDGADGVEPAGDLLQRMTGCLELLKQKASNGPLLVVGHALSGFYLLQAAAGKKQVKEFDPPTQILNADYVKLELADD